ncbi:hypothetical protein C6I20_01285 [Aeromicrobium sp. A1-2]|nr:hypothetical protein C6I20_01285 [Aeromicrobium sp. A1-2]
MAAVLLAALSLSACGDKDDKAAGTSADPKASSANTSKDLTQASFMSVVTAAQSKARTSHVSMDVGFGGQSIKAEGDVEIGASAADTAMSMTMDMGSAVGNMELRLVDQVFYLNFGPMTQNKFAKIDLTDDSNAAGQQYGQLLDQMDPSKQLEAFNEAMTSFEKKGSPKKIDGVDAQPYELVLDTAKIASVAELPGGAADSMPKTLTYTMFLGPDNLPRRMSTEVSGSAITVDYSKWGETVEIKAPSAAEISDQDLGKLMSGELAG